MVPRPSHDRQGGFEQKISNSRWTRHYPKNLFTLLLFILLALFSSKYTIHCKGSWNHSHLVCKQTLDHLVKWSSVRLRTEWFWVRVALQWYRTCFEQGVPWHSGNYKVWIHFKTLTWHGKNRESILTTFYKTCSVTLLHNNKFLWAKGSNKIIHFKQPLKQLH